MIDSLAPGGAEQSLVQMAPHLMKRGINLEVACLRTRRDLLDELHKVGVSVTWCPPNVSRFAATAWVMRLVRERPPDLIHTTLFESDVVGRIAARLRGVPVVSSLVSTPYGPDHLADPALRPWKVRAAHLVDALTGQTTCRFHAVSHEVARVMASRLRVSPSKIDVVPRGRDPVRLGSWSEERRSSARASLDLEENEPLLVTLARQEHAKGLDVLIAALPSIRARFPTTKLLLAGRAGNATRRLRVMIEDFGLAKSVRLVGSRTDVGELLCAADVMVLPSRREGFPGALLEAMALRTPIVATNLPAVREVVGDDVQSLVPPDDAGLLAEAVIQTLEWHDTPGAGGDQLLERFLTNFTLEHAADGLAAFHRRAIRAVRRVPWASESS